jgi:hypothetical protein
MEAVNKPLMDTAFTQGQKSVDFDGWMARLKQKPRRSRASTESEAA